MSPQTQRIAIAEACGWTDCHKCTISQHQFKRGCLFGWPPGFANSRNDSLQLEPPDYLNDLNAMHEAEKVVAGNQAQAYYRTLREVVGYGAMSAHYQNDRLLASATAAQRAEAFLRTLGKWT